MVGPEGAWTQTCSGPGAASVCITGYVTGVATTLTNMQCWDSWNGTNWQATETEIPTTTCRRLPIIRKLEIMAECSPLQLPPLLHQPLLRPRLPLNCLQSPHRARLLRYRPRNRRLGQLREELPLEAFCCFLLSAFSSSSAGEDGVSALRFSHGQHEIQKEDHPGLAGGCHGTGSQNESQLPARNVLSLVH